jgi:hypothetical protein
MEMKDWIALFISAAIGVFGFSVKRSISGNDKKIESLEDADKKLHDLLYREFTHEKVFKQQMDHQTEMFKLMLEAQSREYGLMLTPINAVLNRLEASLNDKADKTHSRDPRK